MADGEPHGEDLTFHNECPSKNNDLILEHEQSVPHADVDEQIVMGATTSTDTSEHDSCPAAAIECDDECHELNEYRTIENVPNKSDEGMSTDATDNETKTEEAPDAW